MTAGGSGTGGGGLPVAERERAELAAYRDLWQAAPPALAAELGLSLREVAGGLCLACGALPETRMLNHAIGIADDARDEDLDAIGAHYAAAGCGYIVAAHEGPLAERLAARGFTPDLPWMTFERPVDGPYPDRPGGPAVSDAAPGEAERFGAIVAQAFGLPEPAARWMAELVGRQGWSCMLARGDDGPIGAGALFSAGPVAWVTFGATVPEHRGRGAQGALFAARRRRADELGVRVLITETGADPEGPGPSYRNILRAGFRETGLRPNWHSP